MELEQHLSSILVIEYSVEMFNDLRNQKKHGVYLLNHSSRAAEMSYSLWSPK